MRRTASPASNQDDPQSAEGRLQMRRRHLKLGMEMQALAARGLDELRQRMERRFISPPTPSTNTRAPAAHGQHLPLGT